MALSEEHILPRSVGGRDDFTIWACQECNSRLGAEVDVLFLRHPLLRTRAIGHGRLPTRHDRAPVRAHLNDGRVLDGRVNWVIQPDGNAGLEFTPDKLQSDGSVWLHQAVVRFPGELPPHISVYVPSMLDHYAFVVPDPASLGLERAMMKVVLGFCYLCHGRPIVSNTAFSVLRAMVFGRHDLAGSCQWVRSLVELKAIIKWLPAEEGHVVIWADSDGHRLLSGVSLGGWELNCVFNVAPFDCVIENRVATWKAVTPG
jgi:HNH endonuclease